jgi:hypothetical protein
MQKPQDDSRALAAVLGLCAVVIATLLLSHPHARIQSFAELVDFEVRHRAINQIVHGAMMAVLTLLMGAHVALVQRLGAGRLTAIIALTALGTGSALMVGSLVLDGFVTPALAARFAAEANDAVQHAIRVQMEFCETCIGLLMPMALVAMAAAAFVWMHPLVRAGGRGVMVGRLSGGIGLAIGTAVVTARPETLNHVLLGGLFLVALWQLALAFAVAETKAARPD